MRHTNIEPWRFRGRPFDPRQRALSRGELREQAIDRLVYGTGGALAAVLFLYMMARRLFE